ncbi:MAG TPA: dihydrolipoyl dehydrogenase [Candidatus Nitrosopelagicus sp.]|nr:dihydrolipoyl dehydrogenase [Candidatus Nitrosopelagicus sp.]
MMYDAVIIGAGPGGYVCAIEISKLGGKVCIVEKNGFGGTCTQRGCIPTKYLHSVGDFVRKASMSKSYGIDSKIDLDYKILKSKMFTTVGKLASGIQLLLKDNGVEIVEGEAEIISPNKVKVGSKILETKNVVIATGSTPVPISGYDFKEKILSTDTFWSMDELPKSIAVIGGGYSGCEFASILNVLGCKVWLIEMEEALMPDNPQEIGKTLEKYMRIDGITVLTNSKVEKITDNGILVNGQNIDVEKILVCVGRKPNIGSDEMKKLGIEFNGKGIDVNKKMLTSVSNIYAIGDITGKYQLAHVASKQGEVAAHNITGHDSEMDYSVIPFCVFTFPEVAFVGDCSGKSGEFPLRANAKANCLEDTRGFLKVFEKNGICVGAIIIGTRASEIIGEVTIAIKTQLKIEKFLEVIHAHPTLSEAFTEAVRDINGQSIHLPSRTKS